MVKNDSGMDETSATITIKKVGEKKKKEEEVVEETIEVEEEDLPAEVKRGPFGVLLTKAKQNRSVFSVSSANIQANVYVHRFMFVVFVSVVFFFWNICCFNILYVCLLSIHVTNFSCQSIYVDGNFFCLFICITLQLYILLFRENRTQFASKMDRTYVIKRRYLV